MLFKDIGEGDMMEQLMTEYINYLKEIKRASKNTIDSYVSDLKQVITYLEGLGIQNFDSVSETNINSYLLNMEKQGMSSASINRKLVAIRSFILFGIKRGYIHQDVTERITPPKFEKKQPKGITVEQMEALLNAPDLSTSRGRRDKAMLELLYATGMKVSELISLHIEDVVLKLMYVVVKEKTGERLLPFGHAAKEALIKYVEDRISADNKNADNKNEDNKNENNKNADNKNEGNKNGSNLSAVNKNVIDSIEKIKDEPLFFNRFREPLTRQGFWKILKEYARKVGIEEEITPQVIRNSFAIHMLENGADVYSLQELLGHGDVSITQRYTSQSAGKTREVYLRTHPRGK